MPHADLSPLLLGVAGVVLLLFGRRLYWLFVGLAGFVVGFVVAERLLEVEPAALEWVLALLVGVLAALAALLFQKLAIVVIGFLGGGALLFAVAQALDWSLGPWIWIAALVAAVLGALFTRLLFEIGLMVLSSLLGASLVVEATGWLDPKASLLFLGLAAGGILFQLLVGRRRRRR